MREQIPEGGTWAGEDKKGTLAMPWLVDERNASPSQPEGRGLRGRLLHQGQ